MCRLELTRRDMPCRIVSLQPLALVSFSPLASTKLYKFPISQFTINLPCWSLSLFIQNLFTQDSISPSLTHTIHNCVCIYNCGRIKDFNLNCSGHIPTHILANVAHWLKLFPMRTVTWNNAIFLSHCVCVVSAPLLTRKTPPDSGDLISALFLGFMCNPQITNWMYSEYNKCLSRCYSIWWMRLTTCALVCKSPRIFIKNQIRELYYILYCLWKEALRTA